MVNLVGQVEEELVKMLVKVMDKTKDSFKTKAILAVTVDQDQGKGKGKDQGKDINVNNPLPINFPSQDQDQGQELVVKEDKANEVFITMLQQQQYLVR